MDCTTRRHCKLSQLKISISIWKRWYIFSVEHCWCCLLFNLLKLILKNLFLLVLFITSGKKLYSGSKNYIVGISFFQKINIFIRKSLSLLNNFSQNIVKILVHTLKRLILKKKLNTFYRILGSVLKYKKTFNKNILDVFLHE